MLQDWISAGTSTKIAAAIAERGDMWSTRSPEAEPSGIAEGIVSGTRIATPKGWREVEALAPGDLVLTFDHGLQPVVEVRRSVLWTAGATTPRHVWPIRVPAGAIGNRGEMLLLPEQAVMIESDAAETLYGDPFTLVPASALEGYRGAMRVLPERRVEVCSIVFDTEQIVYANGSGLLHAPARPASMVELAAGAGAATEGYSRLSRRQVRDLMACLIAGEAETPTILPAMAPEQTQAPQVRLM